MRTFIVLSCLLVSACASQPYDPYLAIQQDRLMLDWMALQRANRPVVNPIIPSPYTTSSPRICNTYPSFTGATTTMCY